MSSFRVRTATVSDLPDVMRIWRAGIENSLGGPPPDTMDYEAYFQARLEEQTEVFRFFLVENTEGRVVAWQSVMPFRSNPATRGTMAEISLYTDPSSPGPATLAGVTAMLAHADRSPLLFLLAIIAETNLGAANLAKNFGLAHIGTMPATPKAPHLPALRMYLYTCKGVTEAGAEPS